MKEKSLASYTAYYAHGCKSMGEKIEFKFYGVRKMYYFLQKWT